MSVARESADFQGWLEQPYARLGEEHRSAAVAQDSYYSTSVVAVTAGAAAIAILGDAGWFFLVAQSVLAIGGVGMYLRRRGRARAGLATSLVFYGTLNGLMPMLMPGAGIEIFCATNLPALYTFFVPEQARSRTRAMTAMVALYLVTLTLNTAVLSPVWVTAQTVTATWWVVHVLVPLDLLGTTLQILNNHTLQQEFLRQARDRALVASRIKSRIMNAVAHDLRSPLAAALGLLSDLEERVGERVGEPAIDGPSQQVERVLRRTTDLLDLARLEGDDAPPPRPSVRSPNALVRVQLVGFDSARVDLKLDDSSEAPIAFDADGLSRVCAHLVDNALRHGQGRVEVSLHRTESFLVLEVSDEGAGVPHEDRKRAFLPFETMSTDLDDARGGQGIGLALTRALATRAKGRLSHPDGSSTFRLELPWTAAESRPARVEEPLDLRVLIVEDEALNRKIVRRQLERLGCTVETACDGLEAVRIAGEEDFDLVLMDVRMPNMDGLSATRVIKARLRPPPIVALTANALTGDRERCLASGMDGFLAKPMQKGSLFEVLQELGLGGAPPPAAG